MSERAKHNSMKGVGVYDCMLPVYYEQSELVNSSAVSVDF